MHIRRRAESDLDACLTLARVVHRLDGYPPYLPGSLDQFLATPRPLDAWVAHDEGGLIGHVALNPASSDAVMAACRRATGLADEDLGVIARLLVDPRARREGVGRALLRTAARRCAALGRRPALDVVTRFEAAVALYESESWQRVAEVRSRMGDGSTLDEHVFVAPERG